MKVSAVMTAAVVACTLALPANALQYQMQRIDIPGINDITVGGVNSNGEVALSYYDAGSPVLGCVWKDGQVIRTLQRPSGASTIGVMGINAAGEVCGYMQSGGVNMPVKWGTDGCATVLPQLAGFTHADAHGINDQGQIVGCAVEFSPTYHSAAVLWDTDGTISALRPEGLTGSDLGFEINNNGVCVGAYGGHAAYWTKAGSMTMLQQGVRFSGAYGINILGQAVGEMNSVAVRWDPGKGMVTLSLLSGMDYSEADSINSGGYTVGNCYSSTHRATVWDPGGLALDLGLLAGDVGSVAYSINDAGVIVGRSWDSHNIHHAVIWTPVPEPSSLAALAAGIVLLFPRRRSAT